LKTKWIKKVFGGYGILQGERKWYYKSGELEYTVNYVDGIEQYL